MSAPPAPDRPRAWLTQPAFVAVFLLGAAALAWSNTWRAPFVFDDTSSIVENRSIRDLTSWSWLNPPHAAGETVSGRPVLNGTFALNYALSGLDVWSYHAFNVLIHTLAAWALFGIMRRTPIAGERVDGFALIVALVWLLHPLQTEAVTYVVQRAESLMGLFYLLTLYCFIRGAETATPESSPRPEAGSRRRRVWFALSVASGLLGVGTKESMVTIPVMVLFYDRTFVAGSFAAAWRTRRGYYLALASTWLVLGALMTAAGGSRGGTFNFEGHGAWLAYWLTQFQAVVTYLGRSFWPHPLVFEYGTFWISDVGAIAPQILLVLALGVVALVALWRRPVWGFWGFWFFGLLAPTSLLPGTIQMIVEHRMYLPLVAVVVVAAAAVRVALRRLSAPPWMAMSLASLAIASLGAVSFARNRDYASDLTLWGATVAQRPDNARAHYNLGMALAKAGQSGEAHAEFARALTLQPNHAFAHFELGKAAMLAGQWAEAASRFDAALQADPRFVDARVNLGHVLSRLGRVEEAIAQFRIVLAEQPAADVRVSLAGLLMQVGRSAEAAPLIEQALGEAPEVPEIHFYRARVRERAGDLATAETELRTALRLRPDFGAAAMTLGNLLARRGQFADAVGMFRVVLAGEPESFQARNNLANCYLALNRLPEAIAEYERILQTRPNDHSVRANLEIARSMWRK